MRNALLKILFAIALFFNVAATATDAPHKLKLKKLTGQLQQLKQTSLQNQEQIAITRGAINKLDQQMNQLTQTVRKEQKTLAYLKKKQTLSTRQLVAQQTMLAEQIRKAYLRGETPYLKILLDQENSSNIARYTIYYRYINQERLDLITQIKQTLTQMTNTMQAIQEHQQTIKGLLTQKKQQQNQKYDLQVQQQKLLSQLDSKIENTQQQIEVILSNQKRLQRTLIKLKIREPLRIYYPFNKLYGKLHWPAPGPIIANYKSLLDVGGQRLSGVIIKDRQGTPVSAIYSGKIIFANWLRGFGLLTIINHGNQYMSLYAHNQTLYVKVGDQVNTGDVISAAGTNNTGLYFEIRKNGMPVNPGRWCN